MSVFVDRLDVGHDAGSGAGGVGRGAVCCGG